jgi:hypothetical protein
MRSYYILVMLLCIVYNCSAHAAKPPMQVAHMHVKLILSQRRSSAELNYLEQHKYQPQLPTLALPKQRALRSDIAEVLGGFSAVALPLLVAWYTLGNS